MTPEQKLEQIDEILDFGYAKADSITLADPRQTATFWKRLSGIQGEALRAIRLITTTGKDSADNQTD